MPVAMSGPVWLAAGITAAAAGVAVTARPRARPAKPPLHGWSRLVAAELARAWAQVPLGPSSRGRVPTLHGPGGPVVDGWRWRISTPGAVTVGELAGKADAVAAAVNSRRPLVGAIEFRRDPGHEGWGSLAVWPRDPLAEPADVPWAPGTVPACCPAGHVCMGRGRDGGHVHVPVITDGGVVCSLFAGRRMSGKSGGLMLMAAQLAAWGTVDLVLIDTVRHGTDLRYLEPVAAAPIVTSVADARKVIRRARMECDRRLRVMAAHQPPARVLTEFDARTRIVCLVIDELQGVMLDPRCKAELTRFAQETRAPGGMVIDATQYPTTEVVDPTFRQQHAYRVAYRCGNQAEGPVILGQVPDGEGPHLIRTGPGSALADWDQGALEMMRTWWASDAWLTAHAAAIAARP